MLEYPSSESRYETASRRALENTAGARSLRRYKLTPAYRLQLRKAILDAESAELRATTDTEKRRSKLKGEIARLELDLLESGEAPSALSGQIALHLPD
jgi:hypothetical protein